MKPRGVKEVISAVIELGPSKWLRKFGIHEM